MNKIAKRGLIIGAGALTFFLSLGIAYYLTPSKIIKGTFTPLFDNGDEGNGDTSHFMKFVETFAKDTGISETDENEREREYYGMHAEFDNFSLAFRQDETKQLNTIVVNGDLDFLMRGLKDINFNLDLSVDYNARNIPLDLGFVNNTFYFGVKDLRMKVGSTSIDELLGDAENGEYGLIYLLFMASHEEGGINFDVEEYLGEKANDIIDSLFGKMDLSNLAGSFALGGLAEGQNGIGVKVNETETNNGYDFGINLEVRKADEETGEIIKDDSFDVTISVNKEYRLTRVDLGTIDLGNIKLGGAINIDCIKNHIVYEPDNTNYAKYNPTHNYVEIINYRGWLQKLAHFLDEDNQKFGIDFNFNLKGENVDIGAINGSINADFSKIIDISNYKVRNEKVRLNKANDENESLGSKIRNSATFGLALSLLGKDNEEYGNLALKYVDGQGYINLNESLDDENNLVSVLKAKIETETMNWLIDELPGMFDGVSDENTTAALDKLFSFITDSELVTAIKEGDFSVIVDVVKTLRNNENGIEVGLDLSKLGLGNDASIDLFLDARTGLNNKVLNLNINHVELGSLEINASINSNGYQDIELGDETTYDSLSFLPTVFDQVKGIMDTKEAAFSIEGSLLDENDLGITLEGEGQFDYGEKFGFGNLTINQYKYESQNVWYSHQIALDVDNRSNDYSRNNIYFAYGDLNGDNIKGRTTVQSLLDIIDVVKTFMNENKDNPKFTKFIDPIMKTLSLGQFADIINSKDYFRFAKNDVVKSVRRNGNSIDLTIGGSLFGMNGDMLIRVNLKDDKLDSLEAKNIGIKGKTLNLKIGLVEYDASKTSVLNTNDAYIDFSTIALLLKFGLNTTKNDYYHLTANIDLNALAIINASFDMDVHILIKDEYVKIYGIIPDAKLLNLLGSTIQDYNLFADTVKSEFTFETYKQDDPNREDGVGGYFHIKTTETRAVSGRKFIKHYKTTSKNLIKSENIMAYLLNDLLLIKESVTDMIGNVSSEKDEQAPAGNFANLFTATGYKYNESKNQWDIGINLNEITGIDALRDLELTLNGRNDETLAGLTAKLNIKASLVTIKLGATISLDPLDPTVTNWSSSIESTFNGINNVNFPESKLNQPFAYIEQ